jgi:hypothetical protein
MDCNEKYLNRLTSLAHLPPFPSHLIHSDLITLFGFIQVYSTIILININLLMVLDNNRTMDNVQKYNTWTDMLSSQTFRSYMLVSLFRPQISS